LLVNLFLNQRAVARHACLVTDNQFLSKSLVMPKEHLALTIECFQVAIMIWSRSSELEATSIKVLAIIETMN